MLPFSALILRNYYRAIGWNEDNSYSQLTRSSAALLDFQLPQSLILQLANSPTPIFFTSYALDALPQLNGSLTYITTSEALQELGPSRSLSFRHVVDRFRIYPLPHRPLPKDEVWLAGRRVEGRDYLLYSRLHLPSLHLSGLATTRLTPTLQAHLAFLSYPTPPSPRPGSSGGPSHSRQPSASAPTAPGDTGSASAPPRSGQAGGGNIIFSLQHDTGAYAGEYTYSVQDGMVGLRGLWNIGWRGMQRRERLRRERLESLSAGEWGVIEDGDDVEDSDDVLDAHRRRSRAVDEEEMMEGGLKGRFSAGGEVYFSAKQHSFGISTGLRFTTLPDPNPANSSSGGTSHLNPPTTLTLLYNPLIGFLSTAYSAQVSPTLALSSRFGVNVYSYESDLAVGGEWWIGRGRGKRADSQGPIGTSSSLQAETGPGQAEARQAREAILDEGDLRPEQSHPADLTHRHTGAPAGKLVPPAATAPVASGAGSAVTRDVERDGVLKARISGNWSVALLYEARIRNCLVSIGMVSDLLSRQKPIRSIGLEVQYFS